MPQHAIILFVMVPMAAGVLALAVHRNKPAARTVGVLALLLNVVVALWAAATVFATDASGAGQILVSQMGNWPAPFGITIVVDALSALMLTVSSMVCLAVFIFCIGQLPPRFEGGFFHATFLFLVMGVQWSFITGDLFNLFVAFEIMLMASYAMFVVGTTREQMRHAYKYVLLNLLGSTMFVTCAGLIYGQTGTLNMADLARIALAGELPSTAVPVVALLLFVFGGKAAIFPLWYWLPETYPTLPAPIGGLFAGLLTKVGAYVLIRVFVMIFGPESGAATGTAVTISALLLPVVLISAGVTMFLGVLGAVSMHTVRSILAIHIISQVGYMVLAVGLAMAPLSSVDSAEAWALTRELAVAGGVFFIIHNMVVKCALFLCGGLMQAHAGSDDLDRIGGLLRRDPWLAVLFMIAALSLAGLPPLSGFFGKFVLIREGWVQGRYVVTGFAIATSLLTLLSMLKIWSYGFWSPARGRHVEQPPVVPHTGPGKFAVFMLVVVALSMGLGAQKWFDLCRVAARGVANPRPYVAAVLGESRVPRGDAEAAGHAVVLGGEVSR